MSNEGPILLVLSKIVGFLYCPYLLVQIVNLFHLYFSVTHWLSIPSLVDQLFIPHSKEGDKVIILCSIIALFYMIFHVLLGGGQVFLTDCRLQAWCTNYS